MTPLLVKPNSNETPHQSLANVNLSSELDKSLTNMDIRKQSLPVKKLDNISDGFNLLNGDSTKTNNVKLVKQLSLSGSNEDQIVQHGMNQQQRPIANNSIHNQQQQSEEFLTCISRSVSMTSFNSLSNLTLITDSPSWMSLNGYRISPKDHARLQVCFYLFFFAATLSIYVFIYKILFIELVFLLSHILSHN